LAKGYGESVCFILCALCKEALRRRAAAAPGNVPFQVLSRTYATRSEAKSKLVVSYPQTPHISEHTKLLPAFPEPPPDPTPKEDEEEIADDLPLGTGSGGILMMERNIPTTGEHTKKNTHTQRRTPTHSEKERERTILD